MSETNDDQEAPENLESKFQEAVETSTEGIHSIDGDGESEDSDVIEQIKEAEEKELFLFPKIQIENIKDWLDHEHFRLKKRNEESERALREDNAKKAFWFSVGWAIFIAFVVLIKLVWSEACLNETEYIATITTLSVTILTYYMVVVRHLFHKGANNKDDRHTDDSN